MQGFMRNAMNNGASGLNALLMYNAFASPMEEDARQERIRNNIAVWENPETTPEQKLQARIQLASDTGQLDLGYNLQSKRDKDEWSKKMAMLNYYAQQGLMPTGMMEGMGADIRGTVDDSGEFSVYNMPTQGANIDEQVKQLTPEF